MIRRLRRPALAWAALLALGCSELTEAEAGIVAIEVTVPEPAEVTVGENIQLSARALNRAGDVVDAVITWSTPDATITVNGTTGAVTGVTAGTGRVQAESGSFTSGLITLTVVAAPVTP